MSLITYIIIICILFICIPVFKRSKSSVKNSVKSSLCKGKACELVTQRIMTVNIEGFSPKIWKEYSKDDKNMQGLTSVKVKSSNGKETSQVQERFSNKKRAALILDQINKKNLKLLKYITKNSPDHHVTKILNKRYKSGNIFEAHPDIGEIELTSYTTDKKLIGYCMRERESPDNLIDDINLIMFVSIHELGHMASLSMGHNDEFRRNFKWLLEQAVKAKLYTPVDYHKYPVDYCGLKLNTSPLFRA